jgi:hypothetical protein
MTDHVSLDVIAALREGLLEPREAKRARAHVQACSTCAARDEELQRVPAALRRIADAEPAPVPPWVAQRLDAALAAEAGSDGIAPAPLPDDVPSIAGASGSGRRGRGPGSRLLRPLAAAAAVCLLAGGGYAIFRAAEPPAGTRSAALHRATPSASATAPNRGGPLIEPRTVVPGATSPQVIHSGIQYQPAQLQAQVESVLRQTAADRHGRTGKPETPMPGGLHTCVQRIIGSQQPTLVDEASYRGQPATVIVTPEANGPGGEVWVAGQGCSSAGGDVIAHTSINWIP